MKADAQTLAFNQQIEGMMGAGPAWETMSAPELREYLLTSPLAAPPVEIEAASDRMIPGPAGDMPIRVIVPEGPINGVYLHVHGGGWVIGSHDGQDEKLWNRAQKLGVAVVSVGYRMAPEDRYPAAQDDCEAAAAWLAKNAQAEFGSDRLIIGGESAGAHLAVMTLLRMRDNHSYTDFRGAALAYGVYDLRMSPSSRAFGNAPLIINTPVMEWFINHYVDPDQVDDPDVTPLFADLSDMPPAQFYVGTNDPLMDDSLFMSRRWEAAGNETELHVYPGGLHAFDGFPLPIGIEAVARSDSFLARCLTD